MEANIVRVAHVDVELVAPAEAQTLEELTTLRQENRQLRRRLDDIETELKTLRESLARSESPDAAARERESTTRIRRNTQIATKKIRANEKLNKRVRRWMRSFVVLDPRTELAHFFFPGDRDGPLGYVAMRDSQGEAVSSRAMGVDLYRMLQMGTLSTLKRDEVQNKLADPKSGFYYGSKQHLDMFPSSYFSVFRPCSKDSLKLMMTREGTGKGLNIKGKSAKEGVLSGFVPFLQISENDDVNKIHKEYLPESARVRVYYKSEELRNQASTAFSVTLEKQLSGDEPAEASVAGGGLDSLRRQNSLQSLREESLKAAKTPRRKRDKSVFSADAAAEEAAKKVVNIDDYAVFDYESNNFSASAVWGLELPLRLLWEIYVENADISHPVGWETGRKSEPAFMEMNLKGLTTPSAPTVVLYQFDKEKPMNPRGLLIAYEEKTPHQVKPVVSDLDCFLVGAKGKDFNRLPAEQIKLVGWELENIEAMLLKATDEKKKGGAEKVTPWMNGWIERLRIEQEQGVKPPEAGLLGYGDPTSCFVMSEAVTWTRSIGAVRHSAECFNFHFPQCLDEEYLVTWDGFEGPEDLGLTASRASVSQTKGKLGGLKFRYLKEEELRKFLIQRVKDGYGFPLNAKWVLCDKGWGDVWRALNEADGGRRLNPWFPLESGLRKRIERLRTLYPDGYPTTERAKRGDGEASLLFAKLQQSTLGNDVGLSMFIALHRAEDFIARQVKRVSSFADNVVYKRVSKARRSIQIGRFARIQMRGFNVAVCYFETSSMHGDRDDSPLLRPTLGGERAPSPAPASRSSSIDSSEVERFDFREEFVKGENDGPLKLEPESFHDMSFTSVTPVRIVGPPSLIETFEKAGIEQDELEVFLSPWNKITIPLSNRKAAKIPYSSTHFAFVSSVAATSRLTPEQFSEIRDQELPRCDLLVNGGFLYVDRKGSIVGVNAIRTPSTEEVQMGRKSVDDGFRKKASEYSFDMDGPYPLSETARKQLVSQGRMQKLTIAAFKKIGVEAFAWILPEEAFTERTIIRRAARRASRVITGRKSIDSAANIPIGPVPAPFGAFAYAKGANGEGPGCYLRLVPGGIPHAHVTISSDNCTKRFAPFTIHPPLNQTIMELKQCVFLSTAIPVNQQKLLRAGNDIAADGDHQTLDQVNISAGQAVTLHIILEKAPDLKKAQSDPGAAGAEKEMDLPAQLKRSASVVSKFATSGIPSAARRFSQDLQGRVGAAAAALAPAEEAPSSAGPPGRAVRRSSSVTNLFKGVVDVVRVAR